MATGRRVHLLTTKAMTFASCKLIHKSFKKWQRMLYHNLSRGFEKWQLTAAEMRLNGLSPSVVAWRDGVSDNVVKREQIC